MTQALHSPAYSLRRHFVDEFYLREAPQLTSGSLVLDVGGTKILKRGRFDIAQYPLRVIYANLSTAKIPDVQADAASLPFRSGAFDAVVCAELLEHVPAPQAVIDESFRVLRPGGALLACVPFLFRMHGDPHDFGRYTDHYWRSVLASAGYREIAVERQGLFFCVLTDFLKQYVSDGPPWPRLIRSRFARWLACRLQCWALRREADPRLSDDPFVRSFTTGFGIVARK